MCWYGKLLSKQVAEDDIHCKKVIAYNPSHEYYYPYYVRHKDIKKYEFGETYTSDIEVKNIRMHSDNLQHCTIDKGIHCFDWDVEFEQSTVDGKAFIARLLNYASPMYFWYDRMVQRYPILVHCIIPAGATYYRNDYGEIVTDKLQIVVRIRLTDKPDNYD